jgi:hypothetical protein
MLQTGEAFDRRRHRRRRHPGEVGDGGRGHDVGQQVPAEQAHRRQRHQRYRGAVRAPHDVAVLDADPVAESRVHRHHEPLRPHVSRNLERGGIVGVQHGPVRLGLVLEDPPLGRGVFLEAGVPIQVVGGEIEQDRHPWVERVDALELKAAGFDEVNRARGRGLDLAAQRVPDVAADQHLEPAGGEHPAGQRGGGGLALGAGDGHDPPGQPSRRELELADDRRPGSSRRLDDRLPRRDAWTHHDQIGTGEGRQRVAAQLEGDPGGFQRA